MASFFSHSAAVCFAEKTNKFSQMLVLVPCFLCNHIQIPAPEINRKASYAPGILGMSLKLAFGSSSLQIFSTKVSPSLALKQILRTSRTIQVPDVSQSQTQIYTYIYIYSYARVWMAASFQSPAWSSNSSRSMLDNSFCSGQVLPPSVFLCRSTFLLKACNSLHGHSTTVLLARSTFDSMNTGLH